MNYSDSANWHPAANIFPLLTGEPFQELVDDIAANGLFNPIVLHEKQVLDGRNRLLACIKASVEPKFTQWDGTGGSPTLWVVSQNLKRRQLTDLQKSCVAVEAKPLLAAEAKKNLQAAGKTFGSGLPKKDKIAFSEIGKGYSKPITPIKTDQQVAKQFNVTKYKVQEVQKVKDADESVYQEIKKGTITTLPEVKQFIAIKVKAPEIAAKVQAGIISVEQASKNLGIKQTTKALGMSESNEWYTPEKYIEAARQVMGSIDLDPASNDTANEKVVKAKKYFTQDDDGLTKDWAGRIWLNPPYADIGPKFADKLVKEYKSGTVKQAILLVNPRTDAAWFQQLFDYTLCFTNHRLKFWKPDGFGESPTTGSVFIYLGPNRDKFIEVFSQFGSVVEEAK